MTSNDSVKLIRIIIPSQLYSARGETLNYNEHKIYDNLMLRIQSYEE